MVEAFQLRPENGQGRSQLAADMDGEAPFVRQTQWVVALGGWRQGAAGGNQPCPIEPDCQQDLSRRIRRAPQKEGHVTRRCARQVARRAEVVDGGRLPVVGGDDGGALAGLIGEQPGQSAREAKSIRHQVFPDEPIVRARQVAFIEHQIKDAENRLQAGGERLAIRDLVGDPSARDFLLRSSRWSCTPGKTGDGHREARRCGRAERGQGS
jgi:hypothetical protein